MNFLILPVLIYSSSSQMEAPIQPTIVDPAALSCPLKMSKSKISTITKSKYLTQKGSK